MILSVWPTFLYFVFVSAFFGLVASVLTTYWGDGANGSGVAELIAYLNGVNQPKFLSIPTYVTKAIGVSFAVCGSLCIGKEGPLAHIGANVGSMIISLPGFSFLRND
jgi:H+/Cl- antiporter ClcA